MDKNTEECQEVSSMTPAQKSGGEGENEQEPPREVMTKLQHQLEKVQRDIQIQQRQAQRQPSSRSRADSRRGLDSERPGRAGIIGFNPSARLSGVRPRAIDSSTCAPWGHPGDPAVRGQREGWSGHGVPRMPHTRFNWWLGDRMPQPGRPEDLNTSMDVWGDCPSQGEGKTPTFGREHQWSLFSHNHHYQHRFFPPSINPLTGQQNILGHVGGNLLTCPRPVTNIWQRPPPRQFDPTFAAGRMERPILSPFETPVTPNYWPRQNAPGYPPQQGSHLNTLQGDGSHVTNSNEKISEEISSDTDVGGDVHSKNMHDSSQKTDVSCDNVNEKVSAEKNSPMRKNRNSSGPWTPPGLKEDSSFDFSSILGGNQSWHRLILADLSLKVAGEKDKSEPFDSASKQNGTMLVSNQLEDKEIGKDTTNAETESKALDDTQSMSLSGKHDVEKRGEYSDFENSMPSIQYNKRLDMTGSKKDFGTCNNDFQEGIQDFCVPSKISNMDDNNNLFSQPNENLQHVSITSEALLPEKIHSESKQASHTGTNTTKRMQKSPPKAFVPPLQTAVYQRKTDRKTGWRQATNQADTSTSLNLRDMTCPKCHERLKWPHLLVCCHRLCFPCLAAIFDREDLRIQCPYCMSITQTDAGLSNLVLDLHRCREMCSIQVSPFVCTMCSKNKHADTVCRTCPAFLCCDCQLKHKDDQKFSAHRMELVQTVGYDQDGELHPMCKEHPGVLYSRFCVDCSTMVCSSCLQHSHAGHESCDLSTGKQIAGSRFREMNCGLMEMVEHCQKKLQNFNLSKQKVEANIKVVRNNIHKACNQMISYIETFEKSSKNLADKVHSAGVKHLNGLIKEANKYDEERETFEEFCTRYIIDSRPEELTPVLPLLHQQLECLRDFYKKSTLLSPNLSVDLTFDPAYPEFNEAMSRMFVSLRFEHNVTLESLLNSPLGDRAVLEAEQPQPYDRARKPSSETESGGSSSSKEAASSCSNEATSGEDMLKNFIRQTTACKYIFGKYGRGDYDFAEPSGICYLHDNSLAVCDAKNHRVVVYDEGCKFSTVIGQPANLPPLPASANSAETEPSFHRTPGALFFPFRLAQCPVTHNLVIVERPPSTDIQVFSRDGKFVRCFGNDSLKYPRGITVNELGQILVVESRTMKVFIFSMEGVKLHAFYLSMHLEFPNDIAAKEGNIFISDNRTHCVHVYDYNLEWQRQIGHESLTYFPIGVAVNHLGQVVVADNHNTFNITVFNQDGTFIYGFKSQSKHANCYSVALHPCRTELAVTTKECKVVLFDYNIARQ